jgi:hypothetical protein
MAMLTALTVAAALAASGIISRRTLDYVFICLVAWALFGLIRKAARPVASAILATGISGGLAALQVWQPSLLYTPYLVIFPANLALAFIFARGLLPGRQPVLLKLIRAMGQGPVDDPGFRRFAISQCALWSVMTFATACLAFATMVSAAARASASIALIDLMIFQILWFVLSHYYAALRYNRPESWRSTLRTMVRPDIWSMLRAQ